MAQELYRVDVPGSMMLMGEHAVLEGMQAIVCAVNKRITLELMPRTDQMVIITDTRLGTLEMSRNDLCVREPFKFVLGAILLFKDNISQGFTINIKAQFASTIGLGSSAAVTVGTVALLYKWLYGTQNLQQIFNRSKDVILQIQGVGSGADVAASVYGGVLAYSLQTINALPPIPNLTAVYCGYKTATCKVIDIVAGNKVREPVKYQSIFAGMHACAANAITAIRNGDWQLLGSLFNEHHALQQALGVSDNLLDALVQNLNLQPEIFGAKISGSGLGDCVIGLGELHKQIIAANDDVQQFPVVIDTLGLSYANN